MKLPIKLLIVATAISFSACKGGDKKDGNAKTEYAEASNDEANQIVEYNNVLVAYTDKNNTYLKSMESNVQRIARGLEQPNNQYAFIGIITPFSVPHFSKSTMKPETPPKVLSGEDQKFFKDNVLALNESFEKMKNTYKSLDDYIKAEDFKDDKGIKGKALVDSIYAMSKTYYKYDDQLLTKLEVIGDDAERIILKTHPLKEYIFAMKDDRKAVADFNKLILETKNYKADEAKIKTAYTALEAQNKKHTEMDAPNAAKYPGKDDSFRRFNESFKEFLIETKKVMRDAATSGKITENDTENLIRKHEYMRTSYNSFVD